MPKTRGSTSTHGSSWRRQRRMTSCGTLLRYVHFPPCFLLPASWPLPSSVSRLVGLAQQKHCWAGSCCEVTVVCAEAQNQTFLSFCVMMWKQGELLHDFSKTTNTVRVFGILWVNVRVLFVQPHKLPCLKLNWIKCCSSPSVPDGVWGEDARFPQDVLGQEDSGVDHFSWGSAFGCSLPEWSLRAGRPGPQWLCRWEQGQYV